MTGKSHTRPDKQGQDFQTQVELKAERKMISRREKHRNIWFGLGMFGLIGWTVTIPTLIGVAIGVWIDKKWPTPFSWTLMLLFVGVVLGCVNAWIWVKREGREGAEWKSRLKRK